MDGQQTLRPRPHYSFAARPAVVKVRVRTHAYRDIGQHRLRATSTLQPAMINYGWGAESSEVHIRLRGGCNADIFEIQGPAPLDFPRLQGKGPGLLSDPGVVSSSTSFASPSDRDVASTVSQSNRVAALFDELSAGRNPVEHVNILGGTHASCTKPFRN